MKPFQAPYTMVHNYVIDHITPDLSPNAWKVLCVAIRQTIGWQDETSESGRRESDVITYSQFQRQTGIVSRSTLSRALKECLEKGYLLREEVDRCRGKPAFAYRLNTEYEATGTEIVPMDGAPTGTETVPVGEATGTETVPVSDRSYAVRRSSRLVEPYRDQELHWLAAQPGFDMAFGLLNQRFGPRPRNSCQ